MKAEQVQSFMNRAGKGKIPFLFGLDYEMENGFFIERPLEQQEILWRVENATNVPAEDTSATATAASNGTFFKHRNLSFEEYRSKFHFVQEQLMLGNSFLANLTIKTPLETNYSFEEIFRRSNSPYALLIPDTLVCFSPERFVKISDGRISSNPMKGTIRESEPDAAQLLLNDYKETAEHFTIVDFIRSELSRVATDVTVEKLRYIDKLHTSNGTILQMSSLISGKLGTEKWGDVFFKILPAGSISGAPKRSTLAILKKAEGHPRGFYSGVFGYYDGTTLDSAVMIRYIEQTEDGLFFRSGGGITINSSCLKEYNEVLEKIYLPFVS
ncbi:MAG: aminodeoxychorismate synthase component I [Bacteroidaceae bacterium]